MKLSHLLIVATTVFALSACDRPETASEEAADKINDALDRRPAEEVRDAAEDAADAVEDTAGDIKDSIKERGE